MSNKVLLGLLVSAAVGLGAATASADNYYEPRFEVKKAAVIDKDDYFCKVPIKIKHEKIVLASDDAKIEKKVFKKHDKKFLLLKCFFKDKVWDGHFKDFVDKGFKCKARNDHFDLKTNNSIVVVDFEKKNRHNWNKKHVVAKVFLACLFKLDRKKHDDNNDNNDYNY